MLSLVQYPHVGLQQWIKGEIFIQNFITYNPDNCSCRSRCDGDKRSLSPQSKCNFFTKTNYDKNFTPLSL